jgi:hypothetical protein
MNTRSIAKWTRHKAWAIASLLTACSLLLSSGVVIDRQVVEASSHREAPLISQDPYADNTDTYAFISPSNPDNIVLAASWIPFEGPEGGPNYFEWGKDVLYDIHVDNNGDAKADYTYTLSSSTQVQNPLTFLYNVGPIGADGANWNRQQRYSITETTAQGVKTLLDNVLAPPVNIGSKSTPDYAALNDQFIYKVEDSGDDIAVYAGQTDDAFWVDLQVFDLLTLRGQQPPIGYSQGNNIPVDSVAGFNVHSIVIELPISRLVANGEPVLGVWATARRPAMRVLNGPAGLGTLDNSGDPVQVSRLGMPLTNEVVLPYALKDAFNSISPDVDAVLYTGGAGTQVRDILQKSVEDPEIGNLLCGLYGVPLPGDSNKDCKTEVMLGTLRSGRGDIFDIFLTGMVLAAPFTINTANGPVTLPAGFNVNRPANVVPAEMLRINTNIKGELCSPQPSRLGVLGGDACGFPNGRRLSDDVVEIELLAVAGAAYGVLDARDTGFSFNSALVDVLDDGVYANDRPFRQQFPYIALAQSGQEHIHQNPTQKPVIASTAAAVSASSDDAEQLHYGEIFIRSTQLELGEDDNKARLVGLRFTGLDIPPGATILNAYVQFYAARSQDDPASFAVRGEASDNAATFSRSKNGISQRPATAQTVQWGNVPAWKKGDAQWTPNLAPVVQEIVGRSGWAAGNALALVISGDGERTAVSFDGHAQGAPVLYVEYSVDGLAASAVGNAAGAVTNVVGSSVLLHRQFDASTPLREDSPEDAGAQEDAATTNWIFMPFTQSMP